MKLSKELLNALCRHYGIKGKNAEALIAQYMSIYADFEVRSCTCREIGGRSNEHTTVFYWTRENNGQQEETLQRLLDFRQCRVNEAQGIYNPPEATIYDTDKAVKHVFCGKDIQKHIALNIAKSRSESKTH